jgi:soluble lytic murein transglycosylase-like protein
MKVRRGWVIAAVAFIVLLPLLVAGLRFAISMWPGPVYVPPKPVAPPDLARLRPAFTAGLDALAHKDGRTAVEQLGSFAFGGRAVEEYRLFYFARANELAGDTRAQRLLLAQLWERDPKLAIRDDAGDALGGLYAAAGDWERAADVYRSLAAHSSSPANNAPARWHSIEANFVTGDLASLLYAARSLAIKNPKQPQAAGAIAVVRSLTETPPEKALNLSAAERLERGVSLMRDGDPATALEELNALDADGVGGDLKGPLQLNRGLCLYQTRQYEASNKLLEPLATWNYRISAPALVYSARNYRSLAAGINPIVMKTVIQRVKLHVKGKKTRVVNVKRFVQVVDLAKKAKKEEYERLAAERLRKTLPLPLVAEVRIDVLNQLIGFSEAKNDDASERDLVRQLVKTDPAEDAGLQHFWDKAWSDYVRGDWNGARDGFAFIYDTYQSPNPRRQARYWFARSVEHAGEKGEAQEIYAALAKAPYEDVYAIYAAGRGAAIEAPASNPLKGTDPDWPEIAEKGMPPELRLAYELTALSDAHDARLEIQRNSSRDNQTYTFALQADLYNSEGNMLLMMRALRRAYPQLGSVEQDSVPRYFLRMYHPTLFADSIRKAAAANNLDPYLIMGLIHQESYFNPAARSAPGALGLMQLMPATGKELAQRLHIVSNLENPDVNVRLGTLYFRQLVNLFNGNIQLAIASYNAGRGNVAKWLRAAPKRPDDEMLESIPFPETRTYVKRVTMLESSYRRLYGE